MYDHLPPLKSLRFFETVARHLSFSSAANELCVTQSAVSYQIRILENSLGKPLFLRQGKQVRLTASGEMYYPVVQRLIRTLNQESAKLKGQISGVTRLLAYSSYAIKWLVPKLTEFKHRHPEIDLRLEMNSAVTVDLELRSVDCGISVDDENPLYTYIPLQKEKKVAVCRHDIYLEHQSGNVFDFIKSVPLVDSDEFSEWQAVLKSLKIELPTNHKTYYYSHTILMHQAALEGQGIALCAESLVNEDLQSGKLVQIAIPLHLTPNPCIQFYFCMLKERSNEPALQIVAEWLQEKKNRN